MIIPAQGHFGVSAATGGLAGKLSSSPGARIALELGRLAEFHPLLSDTWELPLLWPLVYLHITEYFTAIFRVKETYVWGVGHT